MSKHQVHRTLAVPFLALVTGLFGSCDGILSNSDYLILVRVSGRPADTTELTAVAKLGDQYAMSGADIAPPYPLDYFSLKLPSTQSGRLTVEVAAVGTDQCKAAAGSVTVDLSQGRSQEVSVNLSALSPRRCSLLISQSGSGSVSLTPTGTPCGASCYDYNQGDTVVLKFLPTGSSYGAQTYVSAGGICDGVNDCSINVSRRVQVEAKFQPRMCLSKWCWYHPLPQGNGLAGMWGTSPTDLWAVGDFGTAMHYDGQTWSLLPTGTTKNLNGVWAPSAGSAVVVGDGGLVMRWNGSSFASDSSGTTSNLNSVWGSSLSNMFAVGDAGVIIRSTGASWTAMTSGTSNNLYRVNGSDAQNVWAVGQSGTVRSLSGTTWNTVPGPGAAPLADVWTSGPNDVWAVGGTTAADCGVFRRDGVMWKSSNTCKTGVTSVWGNSLLDVWSAGGELKIGHYTSSDVTKAITPDILSAGSLKGIIPTYKAAWGQTAGEVWLATDTGNVLRYVANPASTQLLGPLPFMYAKTSDDITAVTGTGTTEYILYRDGTIFSSDGRKIASLPPVPATSVYDGWTAPTGELIVGASSGYVYKYTPGGTWTSLKAATITSAIYSVGGVSASDFYVGSVAGNIYRYLNGTLPSAAVNGTAYSGAIQSIWGRSSNEVWAVCSGGNAIRINNGTPTIVTAVPSGITNLYGVGGPTSPSSHAWIVGAGGFIARTTNGSTWSTILSGVTTDLNTVVALSETDVWIAGDAGVVLHWDGISLKPVAGPFGTRLLNKLHSPAAGDLWLSGSGNTLWRYMP